MLKKNFDEIKEKQFCIDAIFNRFGGDKKLLNKQTTEDLKEMENKIQDVIDFVAELK